MDNLDSDAYDCSIADRYGLRLLNRLGISSSRPHETATGTHPARSWAESGLMTLTGRTPTLCPVALASCADGALNAFRTLSAAPVYPEVSGADLLTERSAITAQRGNSSTFWGGHCRILPSLDGRIAVNLTRPSDWDLLPAWLQTDSVSDWPTLESELTRQKTNTLVSRGRLLGLAVADTREDVQAQCDWVRFVAITDADSQPDRNPTVVDLSSLWAGPLCSNLWQAAGANVIKVESAQRPDGARSGSKAFFNLLNQGKQSLVLDLHTRAGQQALLDLIYKADIVLEGSRPRALRQMGIVAEDVITELPHLTWVSLTGYGRSEPQANWIAYGDDAGVAAGLSEILHQVTGEWMICGDAIADPLTGLHAALAGWASWMHGGGHLLDMSLEKTVRYCIAATAPSDGDYNARQHRWTQYLREHALKPLPPICKRAAWSHAH